MGSVRFLLKDKQQAKIYDCINACIKEFYKKIKVTFTINLQRDVMRGKKLEFCKRCGKRFPDRRFTHKKKGEYESRLDHIKECYGIKGTLKNYKHLFQTDPPTGTIEQRVVDAWRCR